MGRSCSDTIEISTGVYLAGEYPVRAGQVAADEVPLINAGPVSARRAEATALAVKPSERRIVPDVRVELSKNSWDVGMTAAGIGVGNIFGHVPGAIIGGLVMYGWAQWRWRASDDRRS